VQIEIRHKSTVLLSASLQYILLQQLQINPIYMDFKRFKQLHYFVDGKDQGKLYVEYPP